MLPRQKFLVAALLVWLASCSDGHHRGDPSELNGAEIDGLPATLTVSGVGRLDFRIDPELAETIRIRMAQHAADIAAARSEREHLTQSLQFLYFSSGVPGYALAAEHRTVMRALQRYGSEALMPYLLEYGDRLLLSNSRDAIEKSLQIRTFLREEKNGDGSRTTAAAAFPVMIRKSERRRFTTISREEARIARTLMFSDLGASFAKTKANTEDYLRVAGFIGLCKPDLDTICEPEPDKPDDAGFGGDTRERILWNFRDDFGTPSNCGVFLASIDRFLQEGEALADLCEIGDDVEDLSSGGVGTISSRKACADTFVTGPLDAIADDVQRIDGYRACRLEYAGSQRLTRQDMAMQVGKRGGGRQHRQAGKWRTTHATKDFDGITPGSTGFYQVSGIGDVSIKRATNAQKGQRITKKTYKVIALNGNDVEITITRTKDGDLETTTEERKEEIDGDEYMWRRYVTRKKGKKPKVTKECFRNGQKVSCASMPVQDNDNNDNDGTDDTGDPDNGEDTDGTDDANAETTTSPYPDADPCREFLSEEPVAGPGITERWHSYPAEPDVNVELPGACLLSATAPGGQCGPSAFLCDLYVDGDCSCAPPQGGEVPWYGQVCRTAYCADGGRCDPVTGACIVEGGVGGEPGQGWSPPIVTPPAATPEMSWFEDRLLTLDEAFLQAEQAR